MQKNYGKTKHKQGKNGRAAPALGYDDADNVPGTGDELTVGILQTTFQHDNGTNTCLDLFSHCPSQNAKQWIVSKGVWIGYQLADCLTNR